MTRKGCVALADANNTHIPSIRHKPNAKPDNTVQLQVRAAGALTTCDHRPNATVSMP